MSRSPVASNIGRACSLWQRLHIVEVTNYLAVLIVGVPVAILATDIFPGTPVFKGQAPAIVIALACAAVAFVLWLNYKPTFQYPILVRQFLISMLLAWLVISMLDRFDGQGVAYTSYLVPLLLAMLLLKPLSPKDAKRAGIALAWATIFAVVVAEAHAMLTGYRGTEVSILIRVPGLTETISSGGRWVGPFENPNYAGPAAVYLIIFGWYLRGVQRWIIVGSGLVMLVLSGSRSAMFGLLVGAAVYLIFDGWVDRSRLSRSRRTLGAIGGVAVLAVIAVRADPSLNGRAPIWPQYWEFWLSSPARGVGTTHIDALIGNWAKDQWPLELNPGLMGTQALEPWFIHAHNEILDLLGRFGLIGAAFLVVALTISLIASTRSAFLGDAKSLGLVGAFLAIGVVEVHGSWLYWTLPALWLLLAVLTTPSVPVTVTELQQRCSEAPLSSDNRR